MPSEPVLAGADLPDAGLYTVTVMPTAGAWAPLELTCSKRPRTSAALATPAATSRSTTIRLQNLRMKLFLVFMVESPVEMAPSIVMPLVREQVAAQSQSRQAIFEARCALL